MEEISTQPRRKIRRVRLTLSYIFLIVWIAGIIIFIVYDNPFITEWLVSGGAASVLLIITLLLPSTKEMYFEEKLVIIILIFPFTLIVTIFLFIIVLGLVGIHLKKQFLGFYQ